MILLSDLSVLNPPPGQWIMAVVKAYFDDSGDEEDRQHKVCTVAGYIATVKKWRKFEKLWKQTLREYKVPYLHMREFAPSIGPFEKEFKDNEQKRRQFLQSLISKMEDVNLIGMASIIRLDDLRRFNADNNLHIDAYSFNLYVCMTIAGQIYGSGTIEIIIDKVNKQRPKLDKALKYLETDVLYSEIGNRIQPIPLAKYESFKEILPIQAADFIAWEARKDVDTKDPWYSTVKQGNDVNQWRRSLSKWCGQKNIPYARKSLENLLETILTQGVVWDYSYFRKIDDGRKHIWP